mgnify:CR=1 FL=1
MHVSLYHAQVNAQLEKTNDLPADCQYSVAEVREIFAASMTQAQQQKAGERLGGQQSDPTSCSSGTDVSSATASASSVSASVSASVASTSQVSTEAMMKKQPKQEEEEEDLTFTEVFRRAQERQVENDKLKEAMFQRGVYANSACPTSVDMYL